MLSRRCGMAKQLILTLLVEHTAVNCEGAYEVCYWNSARDAAWVAMGRELRGIGLDAAKPGFTAGLKVSYMTVLAPAITTLCATIFCPYYNPDKGVMFIFGTSTPRNTNRSIIVLEHTQVDIRYRSSPKGTSVHMSPSKTFLIYAKIQISPGTNDAQGILS